MRLLNSSQVARMLGYKNPRYFMKNIAPLDNFPKGMKLKTVNGKLSGYRWSEKDIETWLKSNLVTEEEL